MLLRLFEEPRILMAMQNGLRIDRRRWPLKDGYPAVASKRTQVVTYSLSHFEVCVVAFCPTFLLWHFQSNILSHMIGRMAAYAPEVHTRRHYHCRTSCAPGSTHIHRCNGCQPCCPLS